MAHVQCTDVQERPTEFFDLTSLTRDEFQCWSRLLRSPFRRIWRGSVATLPFGGKI